MRFKLFATTCLVLAVGSVSAGRYDHDYGEGHGGGHGFYGYPVGRKWGYSTQIKHPTPKHNYAVSHPQSYPSYGHSRGSAYGHNGYPNYGRNGFQNYGHNSYRPYEQAGFGNMGSGFFPSFNEYQPSYSTTYNRGYAPHDAYGFNRLRRDGSGQDFPANGYNSMGQHKNHNYGGQAYPAPHSSGQNIGAMDDFGGLDGFLGKEFPNYFMQMMPEGFAGLMY